jgi:hypothetical protein
MPQTQTTAQYTTFQPSESDAHSGSAIQPTPKWQRPWQILLWSFRGSLLQLLLVEIGNFDPRILALARTRNHLLSDRAQQCLADHRLILACNRDMIELQKQYHWLGFLEVQAACEAWVLGAESTRCILHSENNNEEPHLP